MANHYKSDTKTKSDGTTVTTIKKHKSGVWGGYEKHSRITKDSKGNIKTEKPSKSVWKDWE